MTNWNANWPPSSAPADHVSVHKDVNEAALWERLSQSSRRAPLEPSWLGEVYSPSLSVELRQALAEKIGMLAEAGWPLVQELINRHGTQRELILAAGLTHQPESRDWLLAQLDQIDSELDADQALVVLQALACWGGELPLALIEHTLGLPGLQLRLAGLQLLSFHAYQLDDSSVLRLCEPLLNDFREPVVLAAIRVLQRRDGSEVSERLAKLSDAGSETVAAAALRALGCIATPNSQRWLLELSQNLPEGERKQLACKQLQQQYRH